MKTRQLLLFLILSTTFLNSFAQHLAWAESIGGTGYEYGNSIASDASGNVYTTGGFINTVDFDPGPGITNLTASGTSSDIYIQKLDASSNLIWVKKIGGTDSDIGLSITADAWGNVYVSGTFRLTVDFDPGPGVVTLTNPNPSYVMEGFILKLNSNGIFKWAKQILGSDNNLPEIITTDVSGNVVLSGVFYGPTNPTDFDPGTGTYPLLSGGGADVFFMKLDSLGNFMWAGKIGSTGNESIDCVKLDGAGNVYAVGNFANTVDFDPGAGVTNITGTQTAQVDPYFLKLDAAGNFISVMVIPGGTSSVRFQGLALDAAGNSYICGYFNGTVDFNPGPSIHNITSFGTNGFILKVDAANNYILSSQVGDYSNVYPRQVFADASQAITIIGEFLGPIDWDVSTGVANLYSSGTGNDIFILKLSNTASFVSVKKIGGTDEEDLEETIVDDNGNIYLAGKYVFTADFDPDTSVVNFTSNGSWDAFFIKLSKCAMSYNSITATSCDSYILNGQTYNISGTYSQTFTNIEGCDSILTLNLTINNSTTNSITTSSCETYTLNGQTYTASGTYIQSLINAEGCDSILTINLTINNSTTHSITTSSCETFTLNGQTYTASGTYSQTFTNIEGCDSILTLNLTINNSTNNSIITSSCATYSLNGQTYTTSGTYIQTLTNAVGCDSVLTLNLTINNATSNSITNSACDSYSLNGQTYTASGTYTQTLTNSQGCDSTLTINLMINTVDVSITVGNASFFANSPTGTYQWLDCNNGYAIIPGETNQIFTPGVNGYYAVIITDNGCVDTSACEWLLTIGINEMSNHEITVYPNPASDYLVISDSSKEKITIQLFDVTGKLILENQSVEISSTVDVKNISNGLYILKINTGNKSITQKLIIE